MKKMLFAMLVLLACAACSKKTPAAGTGDYCAQAVTVQAASDRLDNVNAFSDPTGLRAAMDNFLSEVDHIVPLAPAGVKDDIALLKFKATAFSEALRAKNDDMHQLTQNQKDDAQSVGPVVARIEAFNQTTCGIPVTRSPEPSPS